MGKLKTGEKMSKVHEEKENVRKQNNFDLNYIRKEVQKIIDRHGGGWSVMDYELEDLILIMDLLRGNYAVYEKEYNQNMNDLKKTYDEIVNERNHIIALDNSIKVTRTNLLQLKVDILLEEDLSKL